MAKVNKTSIKGRRLMSGKVVTQTQVRSNCRILNEISLSSMQTTTLPYPVYSPKSAESRKICNSFEKTTFHRLNWVGRTDGRIVIQIF